MRRRIRARSDHAQHLVAHAVEAVVVGEIAGTDDLDAGTAEAAFGELLGEDAGLRAGKIDEGRVRIDVADALQERGEIRIGERDADRFDDLAAAWAKRALNAVSDSMPGAQSLTSFTTRLLPFFAAHSAMIQAC